MTVAELVEQGLSYARRCRSLWLFGFVVGIASGGSSGGGNGSGGAGLAGGGLPFGLSPTRVALIVAALVVVAVAAFILRFICEGALIEGIVRARQGQAMTTREGFRAGWPHWGVLLRIGLIYAVVVVGSLLVLAAPCVIAMRALGMPGAVIVAIPTLLVAIPWLISLHMVQAFAARIAVLENRFAIDAIRKARLFLHGRIMHGLKLIVASLAGTLIISVAGVVAIGVLAVLLFALASAVGFIPAIAIGCLLLIPMAYVLMAMTGTLRSSIWTIGYVTEVES